MLWSCTLYSRLAFLLRLTSCALACSYLHANSVTGVIPESIGNLMKLRQLYLYSNELNGTIPASVCKLENLLEPCVSDPTWSVDAFFSRHATQRPQQQSAHRFHSRLNLWQKELHSLQQRRVLDDSHSCMDEFCALHCGHSSTVWRVACVAAKEGECSKTMDRILLLGIRATCVLVRGTPAL